MAKTYEFVVEELDFYEGCGDDPDITEPHFFYAIEEAVAYASSSDEPWRICLCLTVGNQVEGITARWYAYPDENGVLPMRMESGTGFQDGPIVPNKYRKPFINNKTKLKS